MKTGIKSIELDDYKEIDNEMQQLSWLLREFRIQTPKARIDAYDTLGHPHKHWEWARALHAIKEVYGDRTSISVLDIGAAYSLLGPSLAYLGYDVTEVEPDTACGEERKKINDFLDRFNQNPIHWVQGGFGGLSAISPRDVVMSISTVEHIDIWLEDKCWKEMADLTRPGGLLIVTADVMPEAKKGYLYDDCRWTNYSMEMIRDRVKRLKELGFQTLGEEDYRFHGVFVHDYSFVGIHMKKGEK